MTDPTQLIRQKKDFRRQALAARDMIPAGQRETLSRRILDRLAELPMAADAMCWFVYISVHSEVQTAALVARLLAEGRKVCVPSLDAAAGRMIPSLIRDPAHDLAPGRWGIPEPVPGMVHPVDADFIDIVIVPGVAFAEDGCRMGYGGGYYDRYLSSCRGVRVGVAFEAQIYPEVPFEEGRDRKVSWIVTENRVIACAPLKRNYSCRR